MAGPVTGDRPSVMSGIGAAEKGVAACGAGTPFEAALRTHQFVPFFLFRGRRLRVTRPCRAGDQQECKKAPLHRVNRTPEGWLLP